MRGKSSWPIGACVRFTLVASLAASVAASVARAQGEVIVRRFPGAVPNVVRVSSEVHAELADRVVRWEVRETFRNDGGPLAEADYVFPLPHDAAFEDLKLSINGELVAGETLTSQEARAVYEEIVRKRRDPALVEWMGYGMLRARIFPFATGEEKTVVIRFQTVAEREGDAVRIDYVRAGGRSDTTTAENWSMTLRYPSHGVYGTPYSPTHTLTTSTADDYSTVRAAGAGRDITILLPVPQAKKAAIAVLPYAPGGEDGYALITLTPPVRSAAPTPRDVTFVLDISGSMAGHKIEQARAAGKQLLASLASRDRFRLIDFSTDVHAFRDGWTAATPENVEAANHYFDQLEANGSTNIAGALQAALERGDSTDRLPLVLFITDGEPTIGERNPEKLAQYAADHRGRARVFTFGLGADVNASLIEQLALQGRGTAQFVRPEESVERAVSLVARRLTSPVATDLVVRTGDGVQLVHTLPSGPLDLFDGQDAIILTRYTGSGSTRLTFSGQSAAGPVEWSTTAAFPDRERANPFVARLWAAQRVGYLSAERHKNGASPELDDELRSLGLKFGIPTELTSYLVRDPNDLVVNRPMPPGVWSARRIGGVAPSAAPASVAFEAAKTASAQRATGSIAALDSISALRHENKQESMRHAGDRTFTWRDSVWVDSRDHVGLRVVTVKAYSTAYFALINAMPELQAAFAVGERVRVVGRSIAVEVGPTGADQLTDADMAAVRAGW